MILGINGLFSYSGITKIAAKVFLDIIQASLNVVACALKKRLDCSVRQVTHKSCQIITTRRTLGRISKTNALYPALKDNLFGNLIHGVILERFKYGRNKKGETVRTASPGIFHPRISTPRICLLLNLRKNIIGDVEVAKDFLHIVMVLKVLHQIQDLASCISIGNRNRTVRNP